MMESRQADLWEACQQFLSANYPVAEQAPGSLVLSVSSPSGGASRQVVVLDQGLLGGDHWVKVRSILATGIQINHLEVLKRSINLPVGSFVAADSTTVAFDYSMPLGTDIADLDYVVKVLAELGTAFSQQGIEPWMGTK
jgi:hypothetical protein